MKVVVKATAPFDLRDDQKACLLNSGLHHKDGSQFSFEVDDAEMCFYERDSPLIELASIEDLWVLCGNIKEDLVVSFTDELPSIEIYNYYRE